MTIVSIGLFFLVLVGGWLIGAWVSRRRERQVKPIWTWALGFAVVWTLALCYTGAAAFGGLSWPGLTVTCLVGFPLGFMGCVVAAMTAGRGKKP